jgi:hypothetical protein
MNYSQISRYQCEERQRKTEVDIGGGNKKRFEGLEYT